MPGEPWTGEISRENPGTMTSTKTPWQLCLDALNQSLQQALPTGEQIKLVTTLGNLSPRCDLTFPESECSWQSLDYMVGHQGYGALDMKFTNR